MGSSSYSNTIDPMMKIPLKHNFPLKSPQCHPGPLAAETSWLELSTGEPAGPHRWFWGCFGKAGKPWETMSNQQKIATLDW